MLNTQCCNENGNSEWNGMEWIGLDWIGMKMINTIVYWSKFIIGLLILRIQGRKWKFCWDIPISNDTSDLLVYQKSADVWVYMNDRPLWKYSHWAIRWAVFLGKNVWKLTINGHALHKCLLWINLDQLEKKENVLRFSKKKDCKIHMMRCDAFAHNML